MKLWMIGFTRRGTKLCAEIIKAMTDLGHECTGFASAEYLSEELQPLNTSLTEWAKQAFVQAQGIVFVGACGIAVRAIAPYITSKTVDPAVIVVDEYANFAVSLLSGHIGGANTLTVRLARKIGATPVVSTATDLNHQFAVDCFAAENNLFLCDMKVAKAVSSALLDGKPVFLKDDLNQFFPFGTELPDGIEFGESGDLGIYITYREDMNPFILTLRLVPKVLTLGIGCRKGTKEDCIEQAVDEFLKSNYFSTHAVKNICSIDLKAQERGILSFCRHRQLPFITYSAKELQKAPGDYTSSDFVQSITGVDNVCERAAIIGSARGKLIVKKQIFPSVTIAAAVMLGETKI